MKLQRRHWLGNFAWRVEMTRQGTARDTKINIIEFEFPLCILLLCVSTVAFFPRACTHGKVYIPLTFTNEITNRIKG